MATATIGSNLPTDPFELYKIHVDDLLEQAGQFLDGSEVETDEQAEDVSRLLNMLRKAANDADEARKTEKKPHDDAAKAVQTKWKPVLDAADLAVTTCKRALEPFLLRKQEAQRAAAEAARQEAEEKAAAARHAAEQASQADLEGRMKAIALAESAAAAEKTADRLDKQKAQARGGERAVSLRTVWVPTITDRREVLKHYILNRSDELETWLLDQVRQDCRAGKRNVPGVTYTEEKVL